jgi:hypothetical protein
MVKEDKGQVCCRGQVLFGMYLPSVAPGTTIGQIIFSLDKGPVGFMYTGFYRK